MQSQSLFVGAPERYRTRLLSRPSFGSTGRLSLTILAARGVPHSSISFSFNLPQLINTLGCSILYMTLPKRTLCRYELKVPVWNLEGVNCESR